MTKEGWVEIHKEEANGYGKSTSALQMAGGCLVRTFEWGDFNTESSVFIPNCYIQEGQVIKRPTRIALSSTQNVLASEVAAISKRPNELAFTLKCGKDISITADIDLVFSTFMEFDA